MMGEHALEIEVLASSTGENVGSVQEQFAVARGGDESLTQQGTLVVNLLPIAVPRPDACWIDVRVDSLAETRLELRVRSKDAPLPS